MSNNIVSDWSEKAATVLSINTNPGDDTRRFAIIHIAMHDAINSHLETYNRYALIDINYDFKELIVPYEYSVSHAAYLAINWAIDDIKNYVYALDSIGLQVPDMSKANVDDWVSNKKTEVNIWYNTIMGSNSPARVMGICVGQQAFEAIRCKRRNDGRNNVEILSARPPGWTKPDDFRGTYYDKPPDQQLLLANWGLVVLPFVTPNNYHFKSKLGPHSFNSPDYVNEYNEVRDKRKDKDLPGSTYYADEIIAKKWIDHKQHILWNNYAIAKMMEKNITDPWDTSRILALIHTAMADGASAMFNDVYYFHRWRPVSAINITEPTLPPPLPPAQPTPLPWKTYNDTQTPRVPEYPSTFGILGGASWGNTSFNLQG
jgi:hypothetical protein